VQNNGAGRPVRGHRAGNVRALTNQSKAVTGTYAYDAYGQLTAGSESVSNRFRYAGEYQDS
jgi:YD repeat-containing protein